LNDDDCQQVEVSLNHQVQINVQHVYLSIHRDTVTQTQRHRQTAVADWINESVSVTSVWLGSRVISVLDSGAAEGPRFKSQPKRCQVTVLGKLFTPTVPLFTKQRNW